jgi:polyhydroxyalkanoate synthesis regulator phasin
VVITWSGKKPDRLFIYGKKVNDFRQVDYTQVHTMAVSAIQELARQLDALKAENALLKSDNTALKSANHQLEASVDKIDARLRSLENKLSN